MVDKINDVKRDNLPFEIKKKTIKSKYRNNPFSFKEIEFNK